MPQGVLTFTNVIRGTDCAAYLSASLTASERIADAVRREAGRHPSFAAAKDAVLEQLSAQDPFAASGPLDPQAADNAATLLSEMCDLGIACDDAPQVTKGRGA
ncbi:hypothetical protein [Yinghuangia soli]|uniref:Uncharacterized protein n=1 Tax=Yinghuangia soli TaxID=2908204 RepID=A0AA41QAM1_9ACTN|nr:hypothetical protein [Yinghuangia soli]MCF2533277.1 hypothetical protein [Yinghuangia soli]